MGGAFVDVREEKRGLSLFLTEVWPRLGGFLFGALLDRLRLLAEVHRGVDERDVREGLREVAEVAARARVVLFREQPDVVGEAAQALEKFARLVAAPEHHQAVGEPEAASEEHT